MIDRMKKEVCTVEGREVLYTNSLEGDITTEKKMDGYAGIPSSARFE